MTKNRNKKHDTKLTDKIILNRFNLPMNDISWLGHRGKGAILDYELLKGGTLTQLVILSGRKLSAVRAHLYHLKIEHGLNITNEGGIHKIRSQSKIGTQNSLSKKNMLGVNIRTEPANEVRVLVYHLLKEKNPKSIEELVNDLGELVPTWRGSKNLKGRIKRSLENTPSVILKNDEKRGPTEQSRKFSIHLQYTNVQVIELDNKYRLELTKGYIPEIRTNDFRKEDIINNAISNNRIKSEVERKVGCSSKRNEEKMRGNRSHAISDDLFRQSHSSNRDSNWISRLNSKISQTYSILFKNKAKSLGENPELEEKDDLRRPKIQKKSNDLNLEKNDELSEPGEKKELLEQKSKKESKLINLVKNDESSITDSKTHSSLELAELDEKMELSEEKIIEDSKSSTIEDNEAKETLHINVKDELKISNSSVKDEFIGDKSDNVDLNIGIEDVYQEFESSFVFSGYSSILEPRRNAYRIMTIIAGFLNTNGGSLYIGVDDQGYVRGLQKDYKYFDTLNDSLNYERELRKIILKYFNENVSSALSFRFTVNNDLEYLEIIIPKYNKPVLLESHYFQREDVKTLKVTGKDLEIFLKSHEKSKEKVDVKGVVEEQKVDIELNLSLNKLTEIFINDTNSKFSFLSTVGNPFKIYHKGVHKFKWIFLKNISSDFEKDGQLSEHRFLKSSTFDKIENSICIPVGYDAKNRTYVVWNPWHFMNKIYDTGVISVYSMPDKRREVSTGMYMPFELNTGEKYYNVNEIFIGKFLSNIEKYFEQEVIIHMKEIGAQKPGSIYNVMSSDEIPVTNQNSDLGKSLKFILNNEYKKSDIYKILKVPVKQQEGKWNNGYCLHDGTQFIFTNIDQVGHGYEGHNETHFDYDNGFDKDGNLFWEATNASKIHWDSIQKLKASKPYIFVRKPDTKKSFWQFVGVGKCIKIKDTSPVGFLWEIRSNKKENEPDKIKLEQEKSAELSDTSLENYLKSEVLSKRSYNLCKYNGLNNLTDVINYVEKHKSFLKLRNCGKRSNIELIELCNNSNIEHTLVENSINTNSDIIKNLSKIKLEIINSYINIQTSRLSVRSMNAINTYLKLERKSLLETIYSKTIFNVEDMKNVGRASSNELIKYIRDIKAYVQGISLFDNEQVLSKIKLKLLLQKTFGFDNIPENILDGGSVFKIINYLIITNALFDKKSNIIFEESLNLYSGKSAKSRDQVAIKVNLSTERVRQIILQIVKDFPKTFLFVENLKEASQNLYDLDLNNNWIYLNDKDISEINKKESTSFNQQFINYILYLIHKDVFDLVGNVEEVFIPKQSANQNEHKWKNVYVVRKEMFKSFDFKSFTESVFADKHKSRNETAEISFNSYLHTFLYTNNLNIIDDIISICENILRDEFELQLEEGKLIFERNTYKQVYEYSYEALESLGAPSKVSTIYNKVVQLHPNYKTSESGIRASLKSANGFVPVGRSSVFGLKKWENEIEYFKGGTIRSIAEEFLDKFDSPKHTSEITNFVKKYRPNTNEKSVSTNLKLDESDTFVIFKNAMFGLKNKSYSSIFVPLNQDSSHSYGKNNYENSLDLSHIVTEYKLNPFRAFDLYKEIILNENSKMKKKELRERFDKFINS